MNFGPGPVRAYRRKKEILILTILTVFSWIFLWFAVPLPGPSRALQGLGAVFLGSALALRLVCTAYIGGIKNKVLVASGPYSLSRNPLYVASTLGMAGFGLGFGHWLPAVVLGLTAFYVHRRFILQEESYLRHRFEKAYLDYCQTVPRWVGWRVQAWSRAAWHRDHRMNLRLVAITARDFSPLFLVFPCVELLEAIREHSYLIRALF